jgi:anti-anti-sigma regulatory factor
VPAQALRRSMRPKFHTSIQHDGDVSYVKLSGVIDEDNDLAALADRIATPTVVIDLGDVERINSCGVRDWVNWLAMLETKGTHSVLIECSPPIVAQINLVNNFTGNGVVKSFYVPYFCPECDAEKALLVEATDMGPPPHQPPTCRCDECDLVMDFDDMLDSYFAFMANQRPVVVGEGVLDRASCTDRGTNSKKVRSRSSEVQLSRGSKPSVAHLSIQTLGRPSLRPSPIPLRPSIAPRLGASSGTYALIAILIAAITVLAYLYTTG